MSPRNREFLNFALSAVAAAASAGVVWGTMQSQVAGKLDATRFVTDSTRRQIEGDAQKVRIEETLRRIEGGLDEANTRLREITCPPTARGCR